MSFIPEATPIISYEKAREAEFTKISESARFASKLGLGCSRGHGLDYRNVSAIREIAEIEEYAIGFSIIAQSVFVGLDKAVRDMVELVR